MQFKYVLISYAFIKKIRKKIAKASSDKSFADFLYVYP